MLTRRRFLQGAGTLLAVGGGVGLYSTVLEPGLRLSVARWNVKHRHWPHAALPLRITILTDLHAVEPWMPVARIERIVETANSLGSDLIVLLGDYVSGLDRFRTDSVPISDWSSALAPLKAPLGVFAVLGNHDWWIDPEGVRRALEMAGIEVLENQALKIEDGKRRFWLAGLGDQWAIPVRGGFRGVDDLSGTLAPTLGDSNPLVLLAHEPDIFVRVPPRVTLTLSGHTHGGQVRLPFLGRPIIPSRYGQRFAYGHIIESRRNRTTDIEDELHMVVSAGLGMTGLPVRFMVPPEIAVVTLDSGYGRAPPRETGPSISS